MKNNELIKNDIDKYIYDNLFLMKDLWTKGKELGGKPVIQIFPHDILVIVQWLKLIKPKTLLEIGTAFGGSGCILKMAFPDLKYITLDLPPPSDWVRTHNQAGRFLPSDVIKEYGDSKDVLSDLIDKYKPDVIFHDGDHSEDPVKRDIKVCYDKKIKWVILHDSHKTYLRQFLLHNNYYEEVYFIHLKGFVTPSPGISILKLKE